MTRKTAIQGSVGVPVSRVTTGESDTNGESF